MRIQINTNNTITEDELRYIYHNLEAIIDKYKSSYQYECYINNRKCYSRWEIELSGNNMFCIVGRKVKIRGKENVVYINIK